MNSWSLTTCRIKTSGERTAAVRRCDGSLVIPEPLRTYAGLAQALDAWDGLAPLLRDLAPDTLDPVDAVESLSVSHPRKLLCVGANYRDHLAEMGVADVPEGTQPYFFIVPPTTTMVGDGEPVRIPDDPALRVDWEAELAIVIGTPGSDIPASEALSHVAGYACFNDVTARGLLRREIAIAAPFTWDWAGAKGLDTFCPLGAVTPAWQIPDPDKLAIRCLVNGTVKQDSSTSDLLVGVADLIAAASRGRTLEPGDVIATGTPAGVGQSRGEQLAVGDVVRVEIEGLASLTNPIRSRDRRSTKVPS
ncbi:fumarylacetoacetate hydrolase family protein [Streptomyces sp. NPDC048430]|uniref:fumarylacetoacetate hydrolase family protein n=1 Tax=Streptomyces sp. NPDC048430 TaxID=3155388 RepID=UPI003449AC1C